MNTAPAHYPKLPSDPFFNALQRRIKAYFQQKQLSPHADWRARLKVLVLISAYICAYVFILFYGQSAFSIWAAYALMGPLSIFIALNLGHDAAHNAFSPSKKWNQFYLLVFNAFGTSGYLWQLRHVNSHHVFPNVPNLDVDISQSKIVRIFPQAVFKKMHAYQHMYMPPLYLMYTLHWFLIRDFKDMLEPIVGIKKIQSHGWNKWLGLILSKLLFVGILIVIPLIVSDFSLLTVLIGFVSTQVFGSLFLTFILVSAHVGEESVYPEPNPNGEMPHSWVRHQLETTTDFATKSFWVTQLYGGFNHHVVHHLFPHICHIHYPALTRILVQTCNEFDQPYNLNPTLADAIRSHYRLLVKHSQEKQPVFLPEL